VSTLETPKPDLGKCSAGGVCESVPRSKTLSMLQLEPNLNRVMDPSANEEPEAKPLSMGAVEEHKSDAQSKSESQGGDTRAVQFCNKSQLVAMHGTNHTNSSSTKVHQAIMKDVVNQLTGNNVDKMAKDIFSFYICARWVPDEIFWNVVKEELTSQILSSVVNKQEKLNQAIAELYQNFKFIPLLCTRNLEVFGEKSDVTRTYYRKFQEQVAELSSFLNSSTSNQVWKRLRSADETFCNDERMNKMSCDAKFAFNSWLNKATKNWGSWSTDLTTASDKWTVMHQIFKSFKYHASDAAWNKDYAHWKSKFPYHSFIGKPSGAPDSISPTSSQRFMVCFGKRVASDMHRRPAGTNIITDQNSVGCHGWWSPDQVSTMLRRMVQLWRPPTCQLAEKTYTMKKQILTMFQKMNEQLFDALPSMMQDEKVYGTGTIDHQIVHPSPFNVQSASVGSDTYYDSMRVAAINELEYKKTDCGLWCGKITIPTGGAGRLQIKGNNLMVLWDNDVESKLRPITTSEFQVVPQEFGTSNKGILDGVVSGASSVASSAASGISSLVGAFWGGQQTNMAKMLSGSLTKWVVCGVSSNANYTELDTWLGTEDAAFQEHVRQAYSKWTGYKAKVPGQACSAGSLPSELVSAGCEMCDYSELHVDHPEAYFWKNGKKDEFMCPLVPPMTNAEQLNVFKDKKTMCLLHMTPNQQQQHGWHYQGHHPARKQHNRQNNTPMEEFELVKLLDVSSSAGPQQISYGRTCTVEEQAAHPRFCQTPQLIQPWPSVQDMAGSVSSWLQGSLGMPVGAIAQLIGNYQRIAGTNLSQSDKLKAGATAVGEQVWNQLLGLGRLAHSTATAGANEVIYQLAGSSMRHARLQKELFGFGHGGDVLHGASYQEGMGASKTTSTSRQRYSRYAVMCPCDSFDPTLELALRWEWSETALRVLREAARHRPSILYEPSPAIEVRSEARLFFNQQAQAKNNTYFNYGASIRPVVSQGATTPRPAVNCRLEGWNNRCVPSSECQKIGSWWDSQCVPKPPQAAPTRPDWHVVWDGKLARDIGGAPMGKASFSALKALSVKFFCGRKKEFGSEGGPSTTPSSLRSCMEAGVKSNAAMKASKPWKLFFSDEVVVVAVFSNVEPAKCVSNNPATEQSICSGAVKTDGLDSHLGASERSGSTGGEYRGMRTGSGLPKGTVKEVLLKPEDGLQALNLLVR